MTSILDSKSKLVKPPRDAIVRPYVAKKMQRTNAPHPCMAQATSSMHDDGGMSDSSVFAGPYGPKADIRYFQNMTSDFGGICASFGIDDQGRLLTISFTKSATTLLHLDAGTLNPLHAFELPPRSVNLWKAIFETDRIFKTNAGAYFYVDNHSRVVLPTIDREIWVVSQNPTAAPSDYFKATIRLSTDVPKGEAISAIVPVWDATPHGPSDPAPSGYWYVSESGRVGVARPSSMTQVASIQLPNGERIGNSCAIGPKGVFVVSSQALYCFTLEKGVITPKWRTPYTVGPLKPGQLSTGSGTTPTLLGEKYVSIGDASPVMNACVFCQDTGKALSAFPVFGDQPGSACENSFIGWNDSLVVSNTWGYRNPLHMRVYEQACGIVRLDADANGRLSQVWYRKDVAPMSGVPKLALDNGLVYTYSMTWLAKPKRGKTPATDQKGEWRWSVLGLDFETGKTVYEQPIFEGLTSTEHDNGWGTLAPGPNHALYFGMWRGAMRVATP